MRFFIRVRSFNRPSILSHVPGLADVNYAEFRHLCSLALDLTPRNLGKSKTATVRKY